MILDTSNVKQAGVHDNIIDYMDSSSAKYSSHWPMP